MNPAFDNQSTLAYYMAPPQKIHRPPPKFHCPVQGCNKNLQSKSGFTRHVLARHRDIQPADLQPQTESYAASYIELDDHLSPSPSDNLDILDAPHLSDFHDAGDWEDFSFTIGTESSLPPASSCQTPPSPYNVESLQRISTEYHPLINGRPPTFRLYEVLTGVSR